MNLEKFNKAVAKRGEYEILLNESTNLLFELSDAYEITFFETEEERTYNWNTWRKLNRNFKKGSEIIEEIQDFLRYLEVSDNITNIDHKALPQLAEQIFFHHHILPLSLELYSLTSPESLQEIKDYNDHLKDHRSILLDRANDWQDNNQPFLEWNQNQVWDEDN